MMHILMLSTDRTAFSPRSDFANRLAAHGECTKISAIVFCERGRKTMRIGQGVSVYPTNSLAKVFYGIDAFSIAWHLRGSGVSLVTAQDPFETGILGFLVSKMLGVPLELQLHTDLFSPAFVSFSFANKMRSVLAHLLIPRADSIRVVREGIAEEMRKRFQLPLERVFVLPIALPPREEVVFSKGLRDRYPGFDSYLLAVARLEPEKQVHLTIEALATLRAQGRNVALFIAGVGKEGGQLAELAKSLGISEHVFFLGYTSDMETLYRSADIFVTTASYEGYGLAILEAARAGCPIVGFPAGVLGDLLGDSDAFIAREVSPKALTASLEDALSDENGRRARLESARAKAETASLPFPEYASRICEIWRQTISKDNA